MAWACDQSAGNQTPGTGLESGCEGCHILGDMLGTAATSTEYIYPELICSMGYTTETSFYVER